MLGKNPMAIVVKRSKACDEIPHFQARRVKQMGAIPVELNSGIRIAFGIGVPADVLATFDYENR
jgi:hypothetical protein